jgi:hypothetical protein
MIVLSAFISGGLKVSIAFNIAGKFSGAASQKITLGDIFWITLSNSSEVQAPPSV